MRRSGASARRDPSQISSYPNTLPQRAKRIISILLAAAIALAVIAGCGGGGGGGEDTDEIIKATFDRDVDSGRVTMNIGANLRGLSQASGPVSIKVSGPFDGLRDKIKDTRRLPKLALTLAVGAGGQSFTGGFISTGDRAFVGLQGTNYVLGRDDFNRLRNQLQSAQERDRKSNQPDFAALGVNPQNWLKNPSKKGTEDVAGEPTEHIAAEVDVPKLLDDVDEVLKRVKSSSQAGLTAEQRRQLPGRIPPDTKKQIVSAVKEATFDLYSSKDDKTLRKLDVHLKFDVPESLRERLQGLRGGTVDFTLQLSDVNKPQTVTAPKGARPFSELQQQLGSGALGGLGASGSGSSGGSSNGSSGSSGASARYLECVQNATSQAELKDCADLLK